MVHPACRISIDVRFMADITISTLRGLPASPAYRMHVAFSDLLCKRMYKTYRNANNFHALHAECSKGKRIDDAIHTLWCESTWI